MTLLFLNGNRSYQYSLVDADGNPAISTIPDEDFFYINIKSAYYTGDSNTFDPLDFELYAMDDGPGTDCKISVNEESSTEDLFCMFDVMEGDLWYHEINLEYNAPPGMCAYLGFLPHWHYNYAVGYGPLFVAQKRLPELDRDGNPLFGYIGCKKKPTIDIISSSCSEDDCKDQTACENADHWCNGTYCSNGGCTNEDDCEDTTNSCNSASYCSNRGCISETTCRDADHACNGGPGGTVGNWTAGTGQVGTWTQGTAGTWTQIARSVCSKGDEVGGVAKEGEIKTNNCPYNYKQGNKDITCCLGEYTLYKDGKASNTKEKWGDDEDKISKDCLGGLSRIEWPEFNDVGNPKVKTIESGSKGVKEVYTLHPLIGKIKKTVSYPTANFFKDIEDDKVNHTLPNFYTVPPSQYYDKDNNLITFIIRDGNPFITWSCLDNAREAKHRIHLLIREWNTQEEFNSFKESEGKPGRSGYRRYRAHRRKQRRFRV